MEDATSVIAFSVGGRWFYAVNDPSGDLAPGCGVAEGFATAKEAVLHATEVLLDAGDRRWTVRFL